MTKKKKSILSDQRFIVLLVIIVLFAIFSFKSREFRQYTTIPVSYTHLDVYKRQP